MARPADKLIVFDHYRTTSCNEIVENRSTLRNRNVVEAGYFDQQLPGSARRQESLADAGGEVPRMSVPARTTSPSSVASPRSPRVRSSSTSSPSPVCRLVPPETS